MGGMFETEPPLVWFMHESSLISLEIYQKHLCTQTWSFLTIDFKFQWSVAARCLGEKKYKAVLRSFVFIISLWFIYIS